MPQKVLTMSHAEFPQMSDVFFALCKSVDSPFALKSWLLFKNSHKEFLEQTSIDPSVYTTASAFKADYLISSFLSKYKGLETGLDLEAEALQRFTSSEDVCRQTNIRIRQSRAQPIQADVSAIISIAKRKISRLLGPYTTFAVNDAYGWGPGATSDLPRRRAFVDTKMCQLPISVTPKSLPILRQEIGADLHWSAVILDVCIADLVGPFCFLPHVFRVTPDCVIDTVPKNSKTHRVIAKENTGNGFLQKGFGAYLRRRLKCVGIDLDDQTHNQEAARAAYWEGLATIDLKAASDTVAKELVYELLPVDWALALDDVRSHWGVLPNGSRVLFEKFSSMGNGFTFELESLIFWALTSAVTDTLSHGSRVWIYGDDIVCPQSCATFLIEVLNWCGFSVNTEKSYLSGNFFESCGLHFFKGEDVTPVYQKEQVDNVEETVRLGNRLIRCAHRFGRFDTLDKRLHSAWARVQRSAGPSFRFQLPLGAEGDDGWVVTADYFTSRTQDANLGIRCKVISSIKDRFPANDGALLAYSLRSGLPQGDKFGICDFETVRKPTLGGRPHLREGNRWVMPTWEFGLTW